MPYVSPIPLLSEDQRTHFFDIDLKKIRNEILLHFQFSAEPVVEINGEYYDKDEVVTLLEYLQADPGLHWTIFQNADVLELLEQENLQKFNQVKSISELDKHPEYAESIHDLLIDVINTKLPDHILDFTWETTSLLSQIQYYTSKRTIEQQAVAYSNTFNTFRSFTESLESKYPDPFVAPGQFAFKPEMSLILRSEVLKFFKYLPAEFSTCLKELGTWCNIQVVMAFVNEQSKIKSWPKESLLSVIEAAKIAAQVFNEKGNLSIVNQLENYLIARPSSNPWRIVLYVVIGLVSIVRLANSCNRQQNRSYYDRSETSRELKISDERVRDALEAQGFQIDERGNVTKIKTQGLKEMRSLNGGDPLPPQLVIFKDKTWKEKDSLLTIQYETEVLPAGSQKLEAWITEDLLTDVVGKTAYIDLKFIRKGMKGVSFTHRFIHDPDGRLSLARGRIADKTSSGTIAVLPLKDLKRYKGRVSMMDLEGNIYDQDTLSMRLKPNTSFQNVVYNGFADARLSATDSTKLHIRGVRSMCLLGMIRALENVVLKNGLDEAKEIAIYSFNNDHPDSPDALNHSTLARTGGERRALVYTYTSKADYMAYCDIVGDEVNVRYMINTITGEMAGCQIALLNEDRTYVEKIELFLTKE